jgi:hypothetical protein
MPSGILLVAMPRWRGTASIVTKSITALMQRRRSRLFLDASGMRSSLQAVAT